MRNLINRSLRLLEWGWVVHPFLYRRDSFALCPESPANGWHGEGGTGSYKCLLERFGCLPPFSLDVALKHSKSSCLSLEFLRPPGAPSFQPWPVAFSLATRWQPRELALVKLWAINCKTVESRVATCNLKRTATAAKASA